MPRLTRKQLMHRVQIALGELHLSSWTMADKKRLHYVEQGLLALDDEQALLKTGIEVLLEKYQQGLRERGSSRPYNVEANLIQGLQALIKDDPAREGKISLRGPAPSSKTVRLVSVQKNLGKPIKSKAKVK